MSDIVVHGSLCFFFGGLQHAATHGNLRPPHQKTRAIPFYGGSSGSRGPFGTLFCVKLDLSKR